MLSITHYSIITFEYNNTNNERLISFGVLFCKPINIYKIAV